MTKIEWAHHTFNPWIGCTKVSEACRNCYAEYLMVHRMHRVEWGPGKPRSRTSQGSWAKPRKWNRWVAQGLCGQCGHRRIDHADHEHGPCFANRRGRNACRCSAFVVRPRVFCASLADVFDHEVPIEWLVDLLALIHDTPHLDWLLLTKRPELWGERMLGAAQHWDRAQLGMGDTQDWIEGWLASSTGSDAWGPTVPHNVWLGTTVEDQRTRWRVDELAKLPAVLRFLSCEPLVGPLDLRRREWVGGRKGGVGGQATCMAFPKEIGWVIAGGESGDEARPAHPAWFRSLRDQAREADVPFLFKQWGEWAPSGMGDYPAGHGSTPNALEPWKVASSTARSEVGTTTYHANNADGTRYERLVRVGKKNAGRMLDGRVWNQIPVVVDAA